MKAIGIDIGTTTISGAVLDMESRQVLHAETVSNGSFITTKYEWEKIQDTEKILKTAKGLLDKLLEEYPEAERIGLTGQMHGMVYLNQEGKSISPLYTWQDGRGSLPEFGGKALTDLVNEEYGIKVSSGYGLLTHLYQQRKKQIPSGSVSLCTIADYFGMYLTGRRKPLLHTSNGASLGFFSVEQGCFLEEKLLEAGVDTEVLPEVTEELEVLGVYHGIPVTVAIGDNQASFLASVGMEKNTILINMGTGGQLSVLSDQYFEAEGIESRPFVKGRYLLVGASLCGGRAYAILERFFRSYAAAAGLGDASQYALMAGLAARGVNKEDSMEVTTTFSGTRSCPEQRGSIRNLSEKNFTPEGLTAGVLKGMAGELYRMYLDIQRGTEIHAERLVASGNGIRKNPVLQDIFRQMFQAELELAPYEEEAACGAAISSAL